MEELTPELRRIKNLGEQLNAMAREKINYIKAHKMYVDFMEELKIEIY